ncbi:MAG: PHP domain-containing protein [Firmicutes bacterium]|nr:PHP domain-containing protein [Bacillota bacterium]
MKYYIDLHIHSALSPCADDEMTPNNIVNMAALKGLDIIAVTDHNSIGNSEAVIHCGKSAGILVVPGMELETLEEVHLVCLLPDLKQAQLLQTYVYEALPQRKNQEELFGKQLLFNAEDKIKGSESRLLLTAAQISLQEAVHLVQELGGATIPAHIDRRANSILTNLGFIPQDLDFHYLELSASCRTSEFLALHPQLQAYRFIQSSDAHRLEAMVKETGSIELQERSIPCLLNKLNGG